MKLSDRGLELEAAEIYMRYVTHGNKGYRESIGSLIADGVWPGSVGVPMHQLIFTVYVVKDMSLCVESENIRASLAAPGEGLRGQVVPYPQ
eukprot:g38667.t1